MNRDALDAAFTTARYRIVFGCRTVAAVVGQPCPPAVADWLARQHGRRIGWIVTAHNPGATRCTPATNRHRTAALEREATRRGLARLPTRGIDPTGDWPDEPGVLITGTSRQQAHALARRFGQAAIVAVERGRSVRLKWL